MSDLRRDRSSAKAISDLRPACPGGITTGQLQITKSITKTEFALYAILIARQPVTSHSESFRNCSTISLTLGLSLKLVPSREYRITPALSITKVAGRSLHSV